MYTEPLSRIGESFFDKKKIFFSLQPVTFSVICSLVVYNMNSFMHYSLHHTSAYSLFASSNREREKAKETTSCVFLCLGGYLYFTLDITHLERIFGREALHIPVNIYFINLRTCIRIFSPFFFTIAHSGFLLLLVSSAQYCLSARPFPEPLSGVKIDLSGNP